MQPDTKPSVDCLNMREQELLSVMKTLSPCQKAAMEQYLRDFVSQQPQTGQPDQNDSSYRKD